MRIVREYFSIKMFGEESMFSRRYWLILALTIVAAHATISLPAKAQTPAVKDTLAPTGKLRVGVYPGSPTSMVRKAGSDETHGVSFDLGKELAQRLGVPFEPVTYPRLAEIITAMKAGEVDFTVTNATSVRAEIVDFSQTLLSLELGYLVPAHSSIRAIADLDKTGMRVGVTQGSTSQGTLPKVLTSASVVPAPNLKAAVQMMANKELDAFATNKSILFEMSDGMSGARILDGRWGTEHMAIAMPKGRSAAHDYVRAFVADVQKTGLLARAIEQAGLRGTLKAE
jgi:polar amino acid transport system substrate-binding protein